MTEVQGSSSNFLYGKTGRVTFVKGTGTSNVIFEGKPGRFSGTSNVRHLPSNPTGTFFKFEGNKLVKVANPFKAQNASATVKAAVAHPKAIKVATTKKK